MTIGYLADEADWVNGINDADSPDALRQLAADWAPFADDALAVAANMDAEAFERFRVGLASERAKTSAGEDWAREFGALLIPAKFIEGSLVAEYYRVPLGCALIRLDEAAAGEARE